MVTVCGKEDQGLGNLHRARSMLGMGEEIVQFALAAEAARTHFRRGMMSARNAGIEHAPQSHRYP